MHVHTGVHTNISMTCGTRVAKLCMIQLKWKQLVDAKGEFTGCLLSRHDFTSCSTFLGAPFSLVVYANAIQFEAYGSHPQVCRNEVQKMNVTSFICQVLHLWPHSSGTRVPDHYLV